MTPTETLPEDDTLVLHKDRIERGTRWLFGRPYHYGQREATGHLVLLPGPDPREVAR